MYEVCLYIWNNAKKYIWILRPNQRKAKRYTENVFTRIPVPSQFYFFFRREIQYYWCIATVSIT